MNNSISLSRMIRILYLPPYYENHFRLAIERLIPNDKQIEYQVFTIDPKFITDDLNDLLSKCRTIIQEEQIQMIISDSYVGQLLIAKLGEEYPHICSSGMNFLRTLKCLNRFLIIDLFPIDHCIPTLLIDMTKDWEKNFESIKSFLANQKLDGYVKSLYSLDNQLSSFRFIDWKIYEETIDEYTDLYQQQHTINLLPLVRVYISKEQYSFIFQPNYLIQPFFDLVNYPHWRLVVANACIYDKEILMWPLVDGYCGWPFLAQKPLAILPILLCPSRQITFEQQNFIYNRFRQHLTNLITNNHLCYGWMECSYFISCNNEIRLISIKPTYSVYLTEAFNAVSQYGNPITALVRLANRQRPQAPILNGKTIYIHRLWMKKAEECSINDLIHMKEIKRIHRSNICLNRYVRLRYEENEIITNDKREMFLEIGFIHTYGEYYQIGLTNLIELRDSLIKRPDLFSFTSHPSRQSFDPITYLPCNDLLSQLAEMQKKEQKDLI